MFYGTTAQKLKSLNETAEEHYLTAIAKSEQGKVIEQLGLLEDTYEPAKPYLPSFGKR